MKLLFDKKDIENMLVKKAQNGFIDLATDRIEVIFYNDPLGNLTSAEVREKIKGGPPADGGEF